MLTEEMDQTIGTMHWGDSHFVAHSDTSLMPTDRALWAGAFSSPTLSAPFRREVEELTDNNDVGWNNHLSSEESTTKQGAASFIRDVNDKLSA